MKVQKNILSKEDIRVEFQTPTCQQVFDGEWRDQGGSQGGKTGLQRESNTNRISRVSHAEF